MSLGKWAVPLIIAILLLAGCIAPVTPEAPGGAPPTTAAPAPEEPAATPVAAAAPTCIIVLPDFSIVECDAATPEVTAVQRDDACTPIVEFNGQAAASTATASGLVAGWSFGVNFNAGSGGRPFGCLRLYHLAEEESASGALVNVMTPVDQGGIVVDTCTVNQPVTFEAPGAARFCGSGSVTCTLRLSEWFTNADVAALVSGSEYAGQDPEAADHIFALTADGDLAPYPDLTLVARTRWEPLDSGERSCAPISPNQPLLNFTPDGDATPQHALTLLAIEEGEEGASLTFESDCLGQSMWSPGDDWNTTYSTLINGSGGVSRDYQNQYRSASGALQFETCNLVVPSAVEFWLGQGTVTIGSLNGESTHGIIDGILIDPLDSRPPS